MAVLAEPTATPAARGNPVLRILGKVSPSAWSLLVILVLWELSVRIGNVPAYMLPAPSQIFQEFIDYGHRLLPNAGVTLFEVLLGFTLSVLISIPLAVLIVYSRPIERMIYPLIVSSQTVPMVAVAPLLLTWFGYGMTPKIVIVILQTFFPIVVNTVMGLNSASREMIYLAKSMGASNWQVFWKFRLPQALPSIFAGLKLATAMSVIGAIVAEFVGANAGLGYVILVAGASFNITRQFAAIILIILIGVVFFAVLEQVEKLAMPWRRIAR
ncbi:NitT/TauT family transport system permease protein [Devosia sp. YR412]|uniref:ABC transporter permease n=1 Tax=Devosia sp. YR412 TaxID=1881030 RepID=UPI0008B83671|nr:ABC transporter permease [Devosia sp. YR412]SEP79356.1 NitT/TauT family transport system permease protein [Devosia sp. YR412]